MNRNILILIIGMSAVTYIPHAIPAVMIDKMKFSSRVDKFLRLIPYTAMSALIFPGVFIVDAARPEIGILGGIAAIVMAWNKKPVMACVLAAIVIDILLYVLI